MDFLKIFTLRWPEKWMRRRRFFSEEITYSFRDILVTLILFAATVALCLMLRSMDPHNDTSYVAVIFFMDVFLTALLTEGYLFGVIAAVGGVLCVDYIFTAPYWQISFTLAGFPLTFLVMMTISLITCMLTTRVKQAESLRREAEREKIHANLLRAVSHDIRTPLTALMGYLDLLEGKQYQNEAQMEHYVQVSREKARQLKDLTDELFRYFLVFATPEVKMDLQPYDGPILLEQLLGERVVRLMDSGFEVQVIPLEKPCTVMADVAYLQRALDNLFSNVEKHADRAARVTVMGRQEDGRLMVDLVNGVPERPNPVESTKIGLQTVRKIIQDMGGLFEIQMEDGKFLAEISLPCVKEETVC